MNIRRMSVRVLIGVTLLAIAAAACSSAERYTPESLQYAAPAAPASASAQSANEGFNKIGGTSTVNDDAYDVTFFKHYGVNPFIDTEDDHLSTLLLTWIRHLTASPDVS